MVLLGHNELNVLFPLQYYFNDFNLSRDAFMIDQMKKFDGCILLLKIAS